MTIVWTIFIALLWLATICVVLFTIVAMFRRHQRNRVQKRNIDAQLQSQSSKTAFWCTVHGPSDKPCEICLRENQWSTDPYMPRKSGPQARPIPPSRFSSRQWPRKPAEEPKVMAKPRERNTDSDSDPGLMMLAAGVAMAGASAQCAPVATSTIPAADNNNSSGGGGDSSCGGPSGD